MTSRRQFWRWALLIVAGSSSLQCTRLLGVDFDETRSATPLPEANTPSIESDGSMFTNDTGVSSEASPPADSECGGPKNIWTAATKVDPACAWRKVFRLDAWASVDDALSARSIAIARKNSGAITVVYAGDLAADEAFMRTLTFSANTDPPSSPTKSTEPQYAGESNGWGAAMASDGNDIHLVYQTNRDGAGGDIVYRTLGPTGWSSVEPVGAAGPSAMSIAVSPVTRDVMVSFFTPGVGATNGTLYTRLRNRTTGTWDPSRIVTQGFAATNVSGVGQSDLHFDRSGYAQIAYMRSITNSSIRPESGQLLSSVWSAGKVLDANNGINGRSIRLGLSDPKVAAYFAQGSGATKAELRVARWTLDGEIPTISLLAQGIYEREHTSAQHSLDLATDAAGLIHLVYAVPYSQTLCAIHYARESRVVGSIRWMADLVATDIPCDVNGPAVSMLVDTNGRPHIVYSHPTKGIFYATRFDR